MTRIVVDEMPECCNECPFYYMNCNFASTDRHNGKCELLVELDKLEREYK